MMQFCRSTPSIVTLALVLAVPMLVSGCVFSPKTIAYNDPECNVDRHKLELEVQALDSKENSCGGGDPVSCLAVYLAMAGITLTVSESYVLTGNSALWVEKSGDNYRRKLEGRCTPTPPAEKAPVTAPQANAASSVGAAP